MCYWTATTNHLLEIEFILCVNLTDSVVVRSNDKSMAESLGTNLCWHVYYGYITR